MRPIEAENVGRYMIQAKRIWLGDLQNKLTSEFVDEDEKRDIFDFLTEIDRISAVPARATLA